MAYIRAINLIDTHSNIAVTEVERILTVIKDTHYGIVIHREFTPLYCDEVYAKIFGFSSADEVLQLNSLLELIDPKEQHEAQQIYQNVMQRKEKPRVRSFLNRDKNNLPLLIMTIEHIVEWNNKPALQVSIVDLSTTLRAQDALEEREQRYRQLVNGSIQGVLVHRDHQPLFCNLAYAKMFGFKDESDILALHTIKDHIVPCKKNENACTNNHHQMQTKKCTGEPLYIQLIETDILWDGITAKQVTIMDLTEQYQLQNQLKLQANIDELTQLLNRRALTEQFKISLEKANKNDTSLYCIIMDLDDFKAINDTWGHHIGDKVIAEFAQTCLHTLPPSSLIGRWGGEEFVAILEDISLDKAKKLVETIRRTCYQNTVLLEDKNTVRFTASFGLALRMHSDTSIDKLLIRADIAMYQAKHFGKNQLCIAE